MTVSLISLGCPKNLVDSEIILGNLIKANFQLTADWKKSNVVIINTCAFLHSAVKEAEQWIHKTISYKKKGNIKKIIIAGCLSQRYKDSILSKFPDIDGIIGIDDISNINKFLVGQGFSPANKTSTPKGLPYISETIYKTPKYLHNCETPRLLTTNHYAYLKIADGCDNYCSYCLIPQIRGRLRSRKIDDIMQEAKNLAQQGVKELILIAQDTTLYGKDIYNKQSDCNRHCERPKEARQSLNQQYEGDCFEVAFATPSQRHTQEVSLVRLLKRLVKIKDIEWLRVLYTHPAHWTRKLIQAYKDNPKICRYVDLPLQHISNKMLALMNRPYTRIDVEKLLSKLKKIPNIAIRTSFIVGFPNETEKDFQELLKFIKDQKFTHLGCFTYSREQGTVAYNLPNQIPAKIKKERYNAIMAAQQKISLKRMKSFVGKNLQVMIDSPNSDVTLSRMTKGLYYIGRTEFDAPEIDGVVYVTSYVTPHSVILDAKRCGSEATHQAKNLKLKPGDFINVKITSAQPYAIYGTTD